MKWAPIHLNRGGPLISHLFFADDLLLFMKANVEQVEIVKGVLEDFSCVFKTKS